MISADRDAERGHRDGDEPGQAEVLAQGHEDAADHHDRGRHHDREEHVDDLLHLGDVVGAAADERRGAEPGELLRRELPDPARRPTTRTSRPSEAEVCAPIRVAPIVARTCTSETTSMTAPVAQDEGRVADGDALVDDLAVEARQVQRGERADDLEDEQHAQRRGIRREVRADEAVEHQAGPPGAVEDDGDDLGRRRGPGPGRTGGRSRA